MDAASLEHLVQEFREAARRQGPAWIQDQLKDLFTGAEAGGQRRPARRTRPPDRLSPGTAGDPAEKTSRRSRTSQERSTDGGAGRTRGGSRRQRGDTDDPAPGPGRRVIRAAGGGAKPREAGSGAPGTEAARGSPGQADSRQKRGPKGSSTQRAGRGGAKTAPGGAGGPGTGTGCREAAATGRGETGTGGTPGRGAGPTSGAPEGDTGLADSQDTRGRQEGAAGMETRATARAGGQVREEEGTTALRPGQAAGSRGDPEGTSGPPGVESGTGQATTWGHRRSRQRDSRSRTRETRRDPRRSRSGSRHPRWGRRGESRARSRSGTRESWRRGTALGTARRRGDRASRSPTRRREGSRRREHSCSCMSHRCGSSGSGRGRSRARYATAEVRRATRSRSTSRVRSERRHTARDGSGRRQDTRERLASIITAPEASTAGGPGGGRIAVWLIGHSFIYRARRRAAVKKPGLQLGFPEGKVGVHWFGVRGMRWPGVWSTLLQKVKAGRRPDILVIHAGGNDMGLVPQKDLVMAMKNDLDRIRRMFPDIVIVWSEMVPRLVWRHARDGQRIERSRGKVNKLLAAFVRKFNGVVVRHKALEEKLPGYYWKDGVHLSDVGTDLFNLALGEGIERALGRFVGGSWQA
ncbi:mucin-19-like [Xenopus tropicalis]|uniref:Mucin-19-like n=1 Tax=Xenopus tropicalis TaxID=8364 RepID=A0A8J1JHZ1_XENTR|nr:mucin-19-like [Xenopus tropicalis]